MAHILHKMANYALICLPTCTVLKENNEVVHIADYYLHHLSMFWFWNLWHESQNWWYEL